jgi:hypothetical protein
MNIGQMAVLLVMLVCMFSLVVMFVHYHWENDLADEYSDLAGAMQEFGYGVDPELDAWCLKFNRAEWIHAHLVPNWLLPLERSMFD